MAYGVRDHYFQQAKRDNFLARSVYKLVEIQQKYKLLRPEDRVLDLGAAPGSWVQFASQTVGPRGLVVGLDPKEIRHGFPEHVVLYQGSVFDASLVDQVVLHHAPFDVVLSDMAPATSGIRGADSARSALLFEQAFAIAGACLRTGGHFLGKIFQGAEFHHWLRQSKQAFAWTKVIKPDASRKVSREIYILAMRFKNP